MAPGARELSGRIHSRAKRTGRVRDVDARRQRARLLVELRIDERHSALKGPAGQRVDENGGRRSHPYRCRILLEDRHIHPQLAAIGDEKQIHPRLHRLPFNDVLLHDLARTRRSQHQSPRDGTTCVQTVDLVGGNVPQGEPAARARCERVVLEAPGQEILLLRADQIGRVEFQQWLTGADPLPDIVGVELFHPADDARVDVGLPRLGVLEHADRPY